MFTKYAIIENGEVVQYPVNPRVWVASAEKYNIPEYWAGGEFEGKTYVLCHNREPAHTPRQSLKETLPVYDTESGFWYRHYDIVPATEEEIETRIHPYSLGVENAQKMFLQELETLAPKIALLPAEEQQKWAEYAALVNAITLQAGFPFEIDWPQKPIDAAAPKMEVERI